MELRKFPNFSCLKPKRWYMGTPNIIHSAPYGRSRYKWVFPKIGVPQNAWFILENPIKIDDFGSFPYFWVDTQMHFLHFVHQKAHIQQAILESDLHIHHAYCILQGQEESHEHIFLKMYLRDHLTHRIHGTGIFAYICYKQSTKCRQIYHTWILWVMTWIRG